MKRIVVKIGTNLLTTAAGSINREVIGSLARQIAEVRASGSEVLLVSSGAITYGRQVLPKFRPSERINELGLVAEQALAAIGQPLLLAAFAEFFNQHGIQIAQALLSRHDLSSRIGYLNTRSTLEALLEAGVLPIINENDVVSVKEIEGAVYGDNDRLSATVATSIGADLLLLLGTVEGLYSQNPARHADAEVVPTVTEITPAIRASAEGPNAHGKGGMLSKLDAAQICMSSGAGMVIASGLTPDIITRVAAGERLGTYFIPQTSQKDARQRWLATGFTENSGQIQVDDGAAEAIRKKGVSLLPAGIVSLSGNFSRGDIIGIADCQQKILAHGIANYSSTDIDRVKGQKSDQLKPILGYTYGAEIVHRNNMTLA